MGENAYHFMLGFSRARESERPADVAGLARQCSSFDTACADGLAASDSAISRWLESEAGLLERYGDLIARTGYREAYDAGTPMPAFSAILDGQTLLLIRAWAAADEGDTGFIGSALDDDFVFWRMVLAGHFYLDSAFGAVRSGSSGGISESRRSNSFFTTP